MSKAITEKPEDRTAAAGWGPAAETAPSVVREDQPGFARTVGMFGAALVVFGGMALAFNAAGKAVRVSGGWATFTLSLGLAGLLFHAAFDRDLQFRRIYLGFGLLAFAVGAFLCVLPYPASGAQFGPGFVCLALALVFLLATHRNESDPSVRGTVELALGGAGALMAATGLFGGSLTVRFLLPYGLLLSVLGLVYLTAFVNTRGAGNDLGYRAGLGLGAAGLVVLLVALVRSLLPGDYYMPQGLLLLVAGFLYVVVSAGLCSDRPVVVLTRRELGAFFCSPMAYFVLIAVSLMAWWGFLLFINRLIPDPLGRTERIMEPVVRYYFQTWIPIFVNLLAVPMLTMRLLSEEQRSGTLEVLLTAPVSETAVVLSKFLAALVMYVVVWVPFGAFLLSIPLSGGAAFDYRPLLSFFVGLLVMGAGFVSMGLFFSSLTRNQVVSMVLTVAGMITLTFLGVAKDLVAPGGPWEVVLTHVSYLEVWSSTLEGRLVLSNLLFFLSMTVVWLFLATKVLEARKWR